MPEGSMRKIATCLDIPVPDDVRIIPAYSHVRAAGKKGGAAVIKKYGQVPADEEYRREQWRAWWDTRGKQESRFPWEARQVKLPCKSIALAELIGILLGDGGMSEYQVTVSLNQETDSEYIAYVCSLFSELFSLSPRVYPSSDSLVAHIVISRKRLVSYLHEAGVPIGHKLKQGLDIPEWIQSDRAYAIACIRGLIDTDGSVITHRYTVNGKEYSYKKVDFTSASKPLRNSVAGVLAGLAMNPRLAGNSSVRLESKKDVARYFELIGTSNPKHLKRYRS